MAYNSEEDDSEPDWEDHDDNDESPYRIKDDESEFPGFTHEPLGAAISRGVAFDFGGHTAEARSMPHQVENRLSAVRSAPTLSTNRLPQAASTAIKKAKRRGNGDILGVLNIGDQWQERIPRDELRADRASKYGILKLSNNPMLQLTEEIETFENLKELHASVCGIQRLPAELAQLKSLQKLCLFNNPLKIFPAVLLCLEELRELNLGQCDLEEIPKDILKLKELEKLHLRGNRRLRRITAELFGLTRLRELNVGECSLKSLPPELSRLKQLEKLHLFGNSNLRSIPQSMFELSSLREVNAGACGLTSLPTDMEKLPKLETLLLRDNKQLRHVPPAVFSVSTLKELNVAHCGLSEIPEDIGKLKKLERLLIFGNKELQTLPRSLFTLRELREFNACNCNLKDLADIGKLKKLKSLYLRGNDDIRQMPRGITELTDLKELNMGQCGLADISYCIPALLKIKILHLFGNPELRQPSNSMGLLTDLEELSISQCRITDAEFLPLKKFNKLRKLHLSGCSSLKSVLSEVSSLTTLTELDISGCDIGVLPFTTESLEQLAKINIGSNNVQISELDKIFQLKKLEELDISGCNLSKLPDVGEAGQHLKKLDIHGNLLSELPLIALRRLEHLHELNLSCCQLHQIPDEVSYLKYLVLLNVSENQLSTLPPSVKDLALLKVLNISANVGITKLLPAVTFPKTLRDLDISCCPVSSLSNDLLELPELEVLTAQNTGLTEYPNVTLELKSLRKLDISNRPGADILKNVIKDLPVKLVETVLEELLLTGNPMTKPPPEIVEQGLQAIRTYLTDIIPGSQLVCAETVNMLGDTGAGKTSIVQSLRDRRPCLTTEADRTRVMEQFLVPLLSEHFVNINDFGGHDIYQTVLPMFLPPKGLGILAYNMAESIEEQKKKVRRWIITLLAKSPGIRLIVVGTHADLINMEDRIKSEEQIQELVEEMFQKAVTELDEQILTLKIEIRKLNKRNAPTEHINAKVRFIEEAVLAIREAKHIHVSLSCVKDWTEERLNSGLSRLHEVVSMTIKPPDPLPATWCLVMKDILHSSTSETSAGYLSWDEVESIFYTHIPRESNTEKLKMILRYLVATSQIIWLENHPKLGKLVFHRIDHVLKICKAVLHHDEPKGRCMPNRLKVDANRYLSGHLSETFLHYLLKDHLEEVADTMTDLMLQFNLISRVNEGEELVQYIVPSRLEDKAPEEQTPSSERRLCPSVFVRIRFFLSVMPLALFETSLASVLTWVHEKKISPKCWKHGVRFRADGVTLLYVRNIDTLEIKAEADSPQDLWESLHPVLKTVAEHVINLWKGALPECVIECPSCRCFGTSLVAQPGQREVSLEDLTCGERLPKCTWSCEECQQDVPRSLIFSCRPDVIEDKDRDFVQTFTETIAKKCAAQNVVKPHNNLMSKFMKALTYLISHLSECDANAIVDELTSMGLEAESTESYKACLTRTDKIRYLITEIIAHKPENFAEAALQVLQATRREDLVVFVQGQIL